MAHARPPFDFDLNELAPPEEDCANDACPDPAREPLQKDPPAREPSPQDLPPPPSAREPSPQDPPLPPSPDLDLEAPLSPLDEDEDDADGPQLPGPPSLPAAPEPRGSASGEGSSDDGTLGTTRLPYPPSRHGHGESETERHSSQEPSAPRAPSSGPSDTTTSSQRSRHMPPPDVPRDDDAISKRRRRGGGGYDEDAASYSHGGSGHAGGPPSPRRYGQTGGRRLAPAISSGEIGGTRPRNRRRRRRPYGGNQNYGQDQRMQQGCRGREQPQDFRGQKRPPSGHHQAYHGPNCGNALPKFSTTQQGSSDYRPSYSGQYGRDSYHRRQNQAQEPPKITGGYHQDREAVPFSGAHGRERSYLRRQNPKIGGHHQHSREAASFRSPSRAHGRDESYGGRPNPAAQELVPNANGGYQQRDAPHRRGHVPVRPYHPYARDADEFDGTGNQARHESRPNNYQHRRQDRRS